MGNRSRSTGFVSNPNERRNTERYKANGTNAQIEWIDGKSSRIIQAYLKDMSLRGALIEAESAPPPGTIVQFRLTNHAAAGNVTASVVRVSRGRKSVWSLFRPSNPLHCISLVFKAACPYELFKAAIDGFLVESCVNEQVDPDFNPRDWR